MWKVIKTLIYGIKSSGHQAERGLRLMAGKCALKYPRACQIIDKDIMLMIAYQAREASQDCRSIITDELKLVLNKGGFNLKEFTFSGENPLENLSEDGLSIGVGELKWFPKGNFIRFNIHNLNFSPKRRGRKSQD